MGLTKGSEQGRLVTRVQGVEVQVGVDQVGNLRVGARVDELLEQVEVLVCGDALDDASVLF